MTIQGNHRLAPELDRAYLTVRGFVRGGHNNRPAALEALEALTAALPPGDTVDTRLYYTTSDDGVWLDRPDGTSTNLGHGASVADALREL
jgi:hypothetical protein